LRGAALRPRRAGEERRICNFQRAGGEKAAPRKHRRYLPCSLPGPVTGSRAAQAQGVRGRPRGWRTASRLRGRKPKALSDRRPARRRQRGLWRRCACRPQRGHPTRLAGTGSSSSGAALGWVRTFEQGETTPAPQTFCSGLARHTAAPTREMPRETFWPGPGGHTVAAGRHRRTAFGFALRWAGAGLAEPSPWSAECRCLTVRSTRRMSMDSDTRRPLRYSMAGRPCRAGKRTARPLAL
jgi:hypothetical protein